MESPDAPRKPGRPRRPDSKRSLGLARNLNPRKAFHAPPALFEALTRYCNEIRPSCSESEAIRTALEEFLTARERWPPPAAADPTPPK